MLEAPFRMAIPVERGSLHALLTEILHIHSSTLRNAADVDASSKRDGKQAQ